MARIRQDFHTMLRGRDRTKNRDIVIICFYEELPVRVIGEVSLSRKIRKYLTANPRKIVSKDSACLDRYTSIGIHANQMGMTKFLSDQGPNYQNILSELCRFVQPYEQIIGAELQSEKPIFLETQGRSSYGTRSKNFSKTQ